MFLSPENRRRVQKCKHTLNLPKAKLKKMCPVHTNYSKEKMKLKITGKQ